MRRARWRALSRTVVVVYRISHHKVFSERGDGARSPQLFMGG
jgi:hypothetical protein